MIFFISLLFAFIPSKSFAAPLPLTGSSLINQLQSGVVLGQLGFKVQNFPADWQLKTTLESETMSLEMGPPDPHSKAVLSFKSDTVSIKTNLENYVRHYLRDYNQYGFEVIGLQSLKQPGLNSVIVDLNQKNKVTRSRQVFYKKDDKIVTATCIDDFDKFSKTILTCNSIFESFQWR